MRNGAPRLVCQLKQAQSQKRSQGGSEKYIRGAASGHPRRTPATIARKSVGAEMLAIRRLPGGRSVVTDLRTRLRSEVIPQIHLDSMTWAETCGSGVRTGRTRK